MAVVQISKIQVRRGQKNSPSGVPQLSSAEFAWAVDSQELYIGNGSVAEGAPYVGNTKIITEHDNLLELASSYQFAPEYVTGSIPRSLQGKLDETVSVFDFGAKNDGATDCVAAFQLAFTELFRNSNSNYKKVLLVPNGTYLFSSDLKIPSNAIIQGETQHGAVLNIGDNNIQFITSDGDELTNFNSGNRPVNIKISNLTVERTTGQVVLSGVADSSFNNVSFVGNFTMLDTISDIDTEASAVFWENLAVGTRTTNIEFKNCEFTSNSLSVKAIQSSVFSSKIKFDQCKFFVNYYGVYIDGVAGQGNNWSFVDCNFEEIFYHAFKSTNGRYTSFEHSNFKWVGNGNDPVNPLYSMVYFGEKTGNILVNCSSDRQQTFATQYNGRTSVVGSNLSSSAVTHPEAYNSDKASFVDRNYADNIIYTAGGEPVTLLSALNKSYTIRYFLEIGTHTRTGKLTISISDDKTNIAVTDEYQYSPSLTTDPGGNIMINFEFFATQATVGADTVVLNYKQPTNSVPVGSLSFDVMYGV